MRAKTKLAGTLHSSDITSVRVPILLVYAPILPALVCSVVAVASLSWIMRC